MENNKFNFYHFIVSSILFMIALKINDSDILINKTIYLPIIIDTIEVNKLSFSLIFFYTIFTFPIYYNVNIESGFNKIFSYVNIVLYCLIMLMFLTHFYKIVNNPVNLFIPISFFVILFLIFYKIKKSLFIILTIFLSGSYICIKPFWSYDFENVLLCNSPMYGIIVNKDLKNINAKKSIMKYTSFQGISIENVDFSYADLTGSEFRNCVLNNTNFKMAHIDSVVFYKCTFNNNIIFNSDDSVNYISNILFQQNTFNCEIDFNYINFYNSTFHDTTKIFKNSNYTLFYDCESINGLNNGVNLLDISASKAKLYDILKNKYTKEFEMNSILCNNKILVFDKYSEVYFSERIIICQCCKKDIKPSNFINFYHFLKKNYTDRKIEVKKVVFVLDSIIKTDLKPIENIDTIVIGHNNFYI